MKDVVKLYSSTNDSDSSLLGMDSIIPITALVGVIMLGFGGVLLYRSRSDDILDENNDVSSKVENDHEKLLEENIKNWVFDLDNTLYKAECGLFDKVHILMGKFIEEKIGISSGEAQAMRSKYYHKYGTTLRGLMSEHNINPEEYYCSAMALSLTSNIPSGLKSNSL